MKARDWEFDDNFEASREDIEAETKARVEFVNRQYKKQRRFTILEAKIHFFIHGFYQGIAWTLAKHGIDPLEIRRPEIMYAVGIRHAPNEYGMIGGPWPTEKEALNFYPGVEEKPIILMKMEYREEEPLYTPLYRWHDKQDRWRPIKQRKMRRTA